MINWLIKNKEFLSIKAIGEAMQKRYNLHPDTLQKALNGRQKLPKKWIEPINEFVNELRSDDTTIIGLLYKIPPFIQVGKYEFEPKIFNDGGKEIRFVLELTTKTEFGYWENIFFDNSPQSFLWLAESIQSDNDLCEALKDCYDFLVENKIIEG